MMTWPSISNSGGTNIASPEYTRESVNPWTQANPNGNCALWTANPTRLWTDQKPSNKNLPTLQRCISKGTHGAICQTGCMPEMLMPGEILHYIPNAASKIPGYEALDSHYVLVLDDLYKHASYRSDRDWCACLVISSHPPPNLHHHPLRPRTEPCSSSSSPNAEESSLSSTHPLSTTLCDRFHALNCADVPYCTHVAVHSKYDRRCWRAWDWCADTRISLEAPKMVHRSSLHVLRPLTPSLAVRMSADALGIVYRTIEALMMALQGRTATEDAVMIVDDDKMDICL